MIKRYEWLPGGNRINSPALFSLKKRNQGGPERGTQVRVTWKRYTRGRNTFLVLCSLYQAFITSCCWKQDTQGTGAVCQFLCSFIWDRRKLLQPTITHMGSLYCVMLYCGCVTDFCAVLRAAEKVRPGFLLRYQLQWREISWGLACGQKFPRIHWQLGRISTLAWLPSTLALRSSTGTNLGSVL